MQRLEEKATENSSYIIAVELYEKDSATDSRIPIIPNEGLVWHLKNAKGEIINERENQQLPSDSVVYIPLSGNDLALNAAYPALRYVELAGTYDSIYGTNLRIRLQIEFLIENLVD